MVAVLHVQKAVLKHRSPDASRRTVFVDCAKRLECGVFHRRLLDTGNDFRQSRNSRFSRKGIPV